jgi:hypothetical protein
MTAFRKRLTAGLLIFALVSLGFALGRAHESARNAGADDSPGLEALPQDGAAVIYFHKPVRCATCNSIQRQTRNAIDTHFADALAGGRLHWRVYSLADRPALAKRLGVASSHVVLARIVEGRIVEHRILTEAWRLYDKPRQFESFLRAVIGPAVEPDPA